MPQRLIGVGSTVIQVHTFYSGCWKKKEGIQLRYDRVLPGTVNINNGARRASLRHHI